jgi:hypothetical protein
MEEPHESNRDHSTNVAGQHSDQYSPPKAISSSLSENPSRDKHYEKEPQKWYKQSIVSLEIAPIEAGTCKIPECVWQDNARAG